MTGAYLAHLERTELQKNAHALGVHSAFFVIQFSQPALKSDPFIALDGLDLSCTFSLVPSSLIFSLLLGEGARRADEVSFSSNMNYCKLIIFDMGTIVPNNKFGLGDFYRWKFSLLRTLVQLFDFHLQKLRLQIDLLFVIPCIPCLMKKIRFLLS